MEDDKRILLRCALLNKVEVECYKIEKYPVELKHPTFTALTKTEFSTRYFKETDLPKSFSCLKDMSFHYHIIDLDPESMIYMDENH